MTLRKVSATEDSLSLNINAGSDKNGLTDYSTNTPGRMANFDPLSHYPSNNESGSVLNSLAASWTPADNDTNYHSRNNVATRILRKLNANFIDKISGSGNSSVLEQAAAHDHSGKSSDTFSSAFSPDPLTATATSGSDERKELGFSRMTASLISSSFSTTSPTTASSLSSSMTTSSRQENFATAAAGAQGFSLSTSVASNTTTASIHRWITTNETNNSSSSVSSSFAELSSSLPRVMSLVDPQGIKGPMSLSLASPSTSSLSSSFSGGADSIMVADDSERSLTTDFYSNISYMNATEWPGNDTGLDDYTSGNYNYFALLLIIFPLVAMFGNVLVILSVKRERTLWNVTNYFIVSLAVADLLVAAVVMPFAVYLLFNGDWGLPPIFCDFYIAMDVTCSTSSILNLVAISIDRFIAVTQPIKYAKHKSNTRVWLTIVFVWVFSGLVGSPIVLGLNSPPEGQPWDEKECSFHNKYFVLFSSLCSFYIPCTILVYLYYRIFKVIHERAKKAAGGGSRGGATGGATVIENLAQTKRLAETNLSGPSNLASASKKAGRGGDEDGVAGAMDDEKCTNTGSGSQDEGDEKDLDMDMEGDGEDEDSPNSDDCQIITNTKLATAFVLESVRPEDRGLTSRVEPNGNHDSGYAASNLEEGAHPVMVQEPSPASPKYSLSPHDQCKRNGLNRPQKDGGETSLAQSPGDVSSGSAGKKAASRFTLGKVHKASRKKREKSSAKRERKATKTLAIVLGLFLACWLPFFTCNILDAICSMLGKNCSPGMTEFLLTTWLGYVNSCLNPVIYTVFNIEFRKAFKKILGMGP